MHAFDVSVRVKLPSRSFHDARYILKTPPLHIPQIEQLHMARIRKLLDLPHDSKTKVGISGDKIHLGYRCDFLQHDFRADRIAVSCSADAVSA